MTEFNNQQEGVPLNQQQQYHQQPEVVRVTAVQAQPGYPASAYRPYAPVDQNEAENFIVIQPVEHSDYVSPHERYTEDGDGDDRDDNPMCIYIFAVIALFAPIIGLIAVCCYACGKPLGTRSRRAFNFLVICTTLGIIIDLIFGWSYDF